MTSVLFDLDGTLVNSSPGILAAFHFAFLLDVGFQQSKRSLCCFHHNQSPYALLCLEI